MADYSNPDINLSLKDLTKEIWKRILNNLPFLYKSKGTEKCLRGLITCYGIPSSVLEIREYGGPDISESENTSEYHFDNFSYALDFSGSQFVSFPWTSSNSSYPLSVEVRFNSNTTSYSSMSLLTVVSSSNTPSWRLDVLTTSDNKGKVRFKIISGSHSEYMSVTSSELPLFDGNFNHVAVVRSSGSDNPVDQTYSLYVKKNLYNGLFYYSSAELDVTGSDNVGWATNGSTMYVGGYDEQKFLGSVDEIKFWNQILTEKTINFHAKHPKSLIGNDITGSYNDLVLRLPFDNPKNLGNCTSGSLPNMSPSEAYSTASMEIYGFTNEPVFSYNYTGYTYDSVINFTNIGTTRWTNNKVRVESSYLDGNLSPDRKVEKSLYDTAPLDSPKLGIYFSPTNPVDLNIIEFMGLVNIGDLIGDPSEVYENDYENLKALNRLYWDLTERKISINDYLTYIRRYDKSLFENIKHFLPARVKPIIGLLYEPHILERNKVKHIKPVKENLTHNKTITSEVDLPSSDLLKKVILDISETSDVAANDLKKTGSLDTSNTSNVFATDHVHTSSLNSTENLDFTTTDGTHTSSIGLDDVNSININVGHYEDSIINMENIYTFTSSNLPDDYIYNSIINMRPTYNEDKSEYLYWTDNINTNEIISTGAPFFNNIFKRDLYRLPKESILIVSRSETVSTSSYYQTVNPIVNFEFNDSLQESSGSVRYNSPIYQIYDYLGDVTGSLGTFRGYSKYHYKNYRDFSISDKRLKHLGCLNTADTTYDGKQPIEVWTSNPNSLVADPDGIYKLRIE